MRFEFEGQHFRIWFKYEATELGAVEGLRIRQMTKKLEGAA